MEQAPVAVAASAVVHHAGHAASAAPRTHGYTLAQLEELQPDLGVTSALEQALPVPDLMLGGGVLVLIVMFHAFWIRVITNRFLARIESPRTRSTSWFADLLLMLAVNALLVLHLCEVLIWSAALILSGIIGDWAKAAYFAANSYTALGEPFELPHAWRILAPIMAISGIFTFAWTASVLVNFVERYNRLRDARRAKTRKSERDRD